MRKFNLLGHPEKLTRDTSVRLHNNLEKKKISSNFGYDYFDGSRDLGYGGYVYDGRWVSVSKKLIERYKLGENSSFLDVGCAKGFLLYDLLAECKKISVRGLDISTYAKSNAYMGVGKFIDIGNCVNLPYPDDCFDATVAINTVHNLEPAECKRAIKELIRVTKNKSNIFIQVDAYSNEKELALFEDWVLTAKTYLKPKEWLSLFSEVGFEGDYFWTIIGFGSEES